MIGSLLMYACSLEVNVEFIKWGLHIFFASENVIILEIFWTPSLPPSEKRQKMRSISDQCRSNLRAPEGLPEGLSKKFQKCVKRAQKWFKIVKKTFLRL